MWELGLWTLNATSSSSRVWDENFLRHITLFEYHFPVEEIWVQLQMPTKGVSGLFAGLILVINWNMGDKMQEENKWVFFKSLL